MSDPRPYVLHHGDALDVLRGLPAASVDAVVTSPPYAKQRNAEYASIAEAAYPDWTVAWLEALRPALTPRASVLLNIREHVKDGQISDYVHRTRLAVRAAGWREYDELVWIKPSAPPLGHPRRPRRSWERVLWFGRARDPWCDPRANGSAWRGGGPLTSQNFARSSALKRWAGVADSRLMAAGIARCRDYVQVGVGQMPKGIKHPAAYPPALAAWLVRLCCPPGGVILDPFAGSGSTGVAALQGGYRFIGVEREAEYVAIAKARLDGACEVAS